MEYTAETILFCDDSATSTLCYYPSEDSAIYLNEIKTDYQTGSLILTIYLATIIFFVVAIFVLKLTRH